MAKNHRWTEDEKAIVRRDYAFNRASIEDIAARLGVTANAVKGKVNELGLAKATDYRKRPWSADEDEQLRDLITRKRPRTIAIIMGRSLNAVVVRSKRIGCSRRARDGYYTKKDLTAVFGVDHKWVQRRMDEGRLCAKPHDVDPRRSGGGFWRITEASVRRFVQTYPEELNGRNVDLIWMVDLLAGMKTQHGGLQG